MVIAPDALYVVPEPIIKLLPLTVVVVTLREEMLVVTFAEPPAVLNVVTVEGNSTPVVISELLLYVTLRVPPNVGAWESVPAAREIVEPLASVRLPPVVNVPLVKLSVVLTAVAWDNVTPAGLLISRVVTEAGKSDPVTWAELPL